MDYLYMRYVVYFEFRKLAAGEFNFNSPIERNRAHYLAELKDIYKQCQIRGIIYGICLGAFSGYNLPIKQRIILILISRELMSFYYIGNIFSNLEI